MTDLALWLEQQIAEDEKLALDDEFALGDEFYDSHGSHPDGFESEIVYSSARVLAECAAKRQILEMHSRTRFVYRCGTCDPEEISTFPCPTVRAMALPYADRPGYDEAWRPA